jgi:hypothetical protein
MENMFNSIMDDWGLEGGGREKRLLWKLERTKARKDNMNN